MARYVVGDIHGCFETFRALLRRIRFDASRDRLWLVGDAVNRGPDSLETLRWLFAHRARVRMVLGNHDLHLLERYFGRCPAKASDTLDETLRAPDADRLLSWLRSLPMLFTQGPHVLVHAGILPVWGLGKARRLARLAEGALRGEECGALLAERHRISPRRWAEPESDSDRVLWALRVFTQLRCCRSTREPVLAYTGRPEEAPAGCRPWFALPPFDRSRRTVWFGHWAQLGYYRSKQAVCLDSGCVYGGALTAFRLDDGAVFQERSREGSAGCTRC